NSARAGWISAMATARTAIHGANLRPLIELLLSFGLQDDGCTLPRRADRALRWCRAGGGLLGGKDPAGRFSTLDGQTHAPSRYDYHGICARAARPDMSPDFLRVPRPAVRPALPRRPAIFLVPAQTPCAD